MRVKFASLVSTAIVMSSAAFAGTSANSKVYAGDALLLGGAQPKSIAFDGQNRGDVDLELLIRSDEKITRMETIPPGDRFNQQVRKDEILIIRNTSDSEDVWVYWHIDRYSKTADPRRLSAEE